MSDITIIADGEAHEGTIEDRIELKCKFGTLVCHASMCDHDYREFEIDLVANDGREYQVAVIGTNEASHDPHFNDDRIHVYMWDGRHPDDPADFYMDPHGDGFYFDPSE